MNELEFAGQKNPKQNNDLKMAKILHMAERKPGGNYLKVCPYQDSFTITGNLMYFDCVNLPLKL